MPKYEYYCPSNGQTVEVSHPMAVTFSTWGEVCSASGVAVGDTDLLAEVERVITGGITPFTKRTVGSLANVKPAKASHACGGGCTHH